MCMRVQACVCVFMCVSSQGGAGWGGGVVIVDTWGLDWKEGAPLIVDLISKLDGRLTGSFCEVGHTHAQSHTYKHSHKHAHTHS